MTTAQTITIDFDSEMANTRKLLERVPLDDAHRGFKPHEKSMSLERLATHVAESPARLKVVISTDVLEMQPGYKPFIAASSTELLELFDKSVEEARASIATASDTDMEKDWSFKFAGQVIMTQPRTKVVRSFLNHVLHHRAQLGVYLRLNGVPIPGMYGPSADDDWPGRR